MAKTVEHYDFDPRHLPKDLLAAIGLMIRIRPLRRDFRV
jgi:hypothetical protein